MCCDSRVKSVVFVILGCFLIGISCANNNKLSSGDNISPHSVETTTPVNTSSLTATVTETSPSSKITVSSTPPVSSPSSTSALADVSFTLEHEEYNLKLYSDQVGVIEQFKTVPKISDIKYKLEFDETTEKKLGNVLDIDEEIGVLRNKEPIHPGEYIITVKASLVNKDSTKSNKAKVNLKVLGVTVCNGNDKPFFLNAFMKIHITENKADTILPENTKTECEYSMMNQKPSGTFFDLNSATGKLESNNEIDRESKIFGNLAQAHINLEIYIKCSSARKKRSLEYDKNLELSIANFESNGMMSFSQYKNPLEQLQAMLVKNILNHQSDDFQGKKESNQLTTDHKEDVSPNVPEMQEQHCYDSHKETPLCDSIIEDKIMYNTRVMKLLIIIDDVNDNAPEFTEEEYFFGYPDKTLFSIIVPDNIGCFHATDKDIGLNAAIKYSVNNTPEIIIDPCTGIVYPHHAHFKYEQMTFEITATDRDGESDGLSKSVTAKLDILQGFHIMKMLVKRPLTQRNKDIIKKMEEYLKYSVKVLKIVTVPSLEEISGSIELKNDGYDILEYYMIYAHKGQTLVDMNNVVHLLKESKELSEIILWTSVLAGTPFHYVQSKSFFSGMVVVILMLCMGSLVFYMTYIRTGKYFKCFNYFKKTDSTTPLERDEGSIGTSDYVVSFARMHHVNPTFNILETETSKDFTPVTLRAYDTPSTQIINIDELASAPPILVSSNSNSRRNSLGGEDNLGLSVGNESRGRRKSTVSFNEIVEQYHTVHN